MRASIALVVLLAGCDRLFGLTAEIAPDAAAPADEAPAGVSGLLLRQFVHNDAQHVPIVERVDYDSGEVTIERVLDDGGLEPVAVAADGTFAFPLSDQPYRLIVTRSGTVHQIQSAAASLQIDDTHLGRRDGQTAMPTTTLTGAVTGSIGGGLNACGTGAWGERGGIVDAGGNYSFSPWAADLVATDRDDRLYLMQFNLSPTNAKAGVIDRVGVVPTLHMGLGANPVGGVADLKSAQPLYKASITTSRSAEKARLASVYPDFGLASDGWTLAGIVAPEFQNVARCNLAFAVETSDVIGEVAYPGVYPELPLFAAMGEARTRVVTNPAGQGAGLAVATSHLVPVAPSVVAQTYTLAASTVGIPSGFVLAGQALGADGTVVPIPAGTATTMATWTVDHAVDYYRILLVDFGTIGNVSNRVARVFETAEPRITIDTAVLETDHVYVLVVVASTGMPGAATGDFVHHVYPGSVAQGTSTTFRVAR